MGKVKRISMVASSCKIKYKYIIYIQIESIIPKKSNNLETQIGVKFIGDLTHSTVGISKIKKFEENLNEYSKIKRNNLLHLIEIAKKISKGEMTYQQHYNFCKKGISCNKQISLLEQLNKEKEKEIKIKKKDNKLLGNKRVNENKKLNLNNINNINNYNNKQNVINNNTNNRIIQYLPHDLNRIIDEFIYNKRNIPNEELSTHLENIKNYICKTKLNNNSFHLLIKLNRFLNSSRNFSEKIINSEIFIELNNIIKDKIIEDIFQNDNVIDLEENFEDTSEKELIDLINNYYNELVISSSISSTFKKNSNLSGSESLNNDEFFNISSNELEVNEKNNNQKYKLKPLNNENICKILNSVNLGNFSNDNLYDEVKLLSKNYITNNNKNIKSPYLRKRICMKLYKIFSEIMKSLNLKDNDIKNICIAIEKKGRDLDNEMSDNYKNYINEFFKIIKKQLI